MKNYRFADIHSPSLERRAYFQLPTPHYHISRRGWCCAFLLIDVKSNPGPALIIAQVNIHGIRTKIIELRRFFQSNSVDITLIQESKLAQKVSTPTFPGYSVFRKLEKARGLLTFIRNQINVIDLSNKISAIMDMDDPLEQITVKISLRSFRMTIYIPPASSCYRGYRPKLADFIRLEKILICGDLNAKSPLWYKNQRLD